MRAATVPPVVTSNCHPFVFGRHSFMYNGGIDAFDEVVSSSFLRMLHVLTGETPLPKRKDILDHVAPGFVAMIEGSCDTEHMGALYMTYLCADDRKDFRGADDHYSAKQMKNALKAAIQKVQEIQEKHGIQNPDNYYNTCASTHSSSFSSHFNNDRLSRWGEHDWTLLSHQGALRPTLAIRRCCGQLES